MTPRDRGPNRAVWVLLYAVAMALVEAAVVVYLRALDPSAQGPLAVLQTALPRRILVIEVVREAATIVMLVAVAAIAGRTLWQRFLWFAFAFGAWDIGYYAWLSAFIGWPPSLLTWDVLFLIPFPWIGPVAAPVIVSACLIAGAWWLIALDAREPGGIHGMPWFSWLLALAGAAVILVTFMLDARAVLEDGAPPVFRWQLFGGGVALAGVGLVAGVWRQMPRD